MSKSEIIAQQRRWAKNRGYLPDARCYLRRVEDSLFFPFTPTTLEAFMSGSGNEVASTGSRPAKMQALHSSSALAVNVFDHWCRERERTPLVRALDLPAAIESVRFEVQYATGLKGNPPNIDVALRLGNGHVIGIESKFTEWLARKAKGKDCFKAKYFEGAAPLWSAAGLPGCQRLAEALQDRSVAYAYLDAPQLLKHALGMGTALAGDWSLYYVYFDWTGQAADAHREELADFAARLGSEIGFRAITYQELIERLAAGMACDADYLRYIASRYAARALWPDASKARHVRECAEAATTKRE